MVKKHSTLIVNLRGSWPLSHTGRLGCGHPGQDRDIGGILW